MRDQLKEQGYVLREGWDDAIQRDFEIWYRFTEDRSVSHYAFYPRRDHRNSAGFVHGGVIAIFVDHCMGSMCWRLTDGGFGWTITLNLQFVRPARVERWLFAEVRHLTGTDSNILLDARVYSVPKFSGPLVAQAQGSFTVPGKKAKKAVDQQ